VQWLYPNVPVWGTIAPVMYGGSIVLFMLLFMVEFLELKKTHTRLAALSRVFMYLVLVLVVLVPVNYLITKNIVLQTATYYYGVICFSTAWLLHFYSIYRRVLDRYPPAYLYTAGIIPVLASFLFYILHSFNKVDLGFLPFNYMLLGFIIEVIILSFALIYSYNFHRKKNKELTATLSGQQLSFMEQLLNVQEQERKRIAEDLHDELGSNLAALKLKLQKANLSEEGIKEVLQGLDRASDDTRNIAHNLMPPEFEKISLCKLLTGYYSKLNTESAVRINFYCTGEDHHFTKEQDLVIYRIIMELTNNILKHARATEASLQLIYQQKFLEIMAEDNGIGIEEKPTDGIGFHNISSRVSYLSGEMNIDSGSKGTTIIIKIPFKKV
jgi:signal transduction histidine kinase